MKTLGTIGQELKLIVKQGASFGEYLLTIKDKSTNLPINLTGYTFSGNIRRKHTSSTVTATIEFIPTNLVNGQVSIFMSSTETLKLQPKIEYVYDIEYIDPTNKTTPLLYGIVEVYGNV